MVVDLKRTTNSVLVILDCTTWQNISIHSTEEHGYHIPH